MKKNLFFIKSENHNCYLFNRNQKLLSNIHPLVYFYAKVEEYFPELVNKCLNGDFSDLQNQNFPPRWFDLFKREDWEYHYLYYKKLVKNHCFEEKNMNRLGFQLTPESIKYQVANLKQLTFEITDACNLKCKYCAYGEMYCDKDERRDSYLKFEGIKCLIDYLVECWTSSLNTSFMKKIYISFYGGEPLLNIDFIYKTVEYFKTIANKISNIRFVFNLTTNGVLLDKYIDYFVKENISLLVSLDGDKKNNSYRIYHNNSECFEQVFKNVRMIKEKHPVFFEKNINFNAVLHNRNSIEEIYEFFQNEFEKIPAVTHISNSGIKKEKESKFQQMFQSVYESLLKSDNYISIEKKLFTSIPTVNSASIFVHRNLYQFYDNYAHLFENPEIFPRTPTGTCEPFGKKMFVTVNGKILACERIGQQYELGKILNNNVELNYVEIANRYNNYFNKIRNFCDNCYISEECTQCLFYLSPENSTVNCNNHINKVNYEKHLSSQMTFFENKPEMFNKIVNNVIYA